jgi:flagellar motor component MotA
MFLSKRVDVVVVKITTLRGALYAGGALDELTGSTVASTEEQNERFDFMMSALVRLQNEDAPKQIRKSFEKYVPRSPKTFQVDLAMRSFGRRATALLLVL